MNQNESILPEGYTTPSSAGNYLKLELGDNEFRALSKPIMGWIYWDNNSKPVRLKGGPNQKPQVDLNLIKADKQGKKDLKFFWAFVIFNNKTQSIQIAEITQVSIQKGIEEFLRNPRWGNWYAYEINIKKTVEGDKTSYMVLTNPPSPASEAVKKSFVDKGKINLDALFSAQDPFGGTKVVAPVQAPVAAPIAEPASLDPNADSLPF